MQTIVQKPFFLRKPFSKLFWCLNLQRESLIQIEMWVMPPVYKAAVFHASWLKAAGEGALNNRLTGDLTMLHHQLFINESILFFYLRCSLLRITVGFWRCVILFCGGGKKNDQSSTRTSSGDLVTNSLPSFAALPPFPPKRSGDFRAVEQSATLLTKACSCHL